jgi:hypothetical protein
MAAAQSGTPVPSDRIDFIDKDDAGRIFLALDEQIAHPTGPHPHKHFDKVGPADREKRYAGFSGDGPGQQRFAGSRAVPSAEPPWEYAPQAGEFFRVAQKVHDLAKFFLGLIDAGHIFECDLGGLVGIQPCPAFAKDSWPCRRRTASDA